MREAVLGYFPSKGNYPHAPGVIFMVRLKDAEGSKTAPLLLFVVSTDNESGLIKEKKKKKLDK